MSPGAFCTRILARYLAELDCQIEPNLLLGAQPAMSQNRYRRYILIEEDCDSRDQRAVSMRLVVPRHRSLSPDRRELHMPTNILNDVATEVPIEFDNLAKEPVSPPTGGTTTVNNDNTAAATTAVEVKEDGRLQLVIFPVQPPQDGAVLNISVSDVVNGVAITTPNVDFVLTPDPAAANAHLDTSNMTTRPLDSGPPLTSLHR